MWNDFARCLMLIILLAVWMSAPACSQNYNNKDIEELKKQQQTPYPKASPQPAPTPQQKKPGSTDSKGSTTLKGATQSKPASGKAVKKTAGSEKNTVNYTTTEGTIKIEVKSAKLDSRKGNQKPPVRKGAASGQKPDGESTPEPVPVTISDIPMVEKMLPYEKWKSEYEDYFFAHNNEKNISLEPKLIVIRSTYVGSVDTLWNLFSRGSLYDEGDDGSVYGHLSCHFAVDRSGGIYQFLPLNLRSKGAYGVNHVAITIDLIGSTNRDLLDNEHQKKALYELVEALMKNFRIPLSKVYGHYEVSSGKKAVPEYADLNDSDYPDCYSPDKVCYDPGELYMQNLRTFFGKKASKGQ